MFKLKTRERGMRSLRYLLTEYEPGQKVNIVIKSNVHKGRPHRRYQGRTGKVVGKQGDCYVVEVKMGGYIKKLIVNPQHLKLA